MIFPLAHTSSAIDYKNTTILQYADLIQLA